jgi:hypothetical protein
MSARAESVTATERGLTRRPLVRAAVFGTGRAGTEIVRAAHARADIELVAGITVSPDKNGRDLGEVTTGRPLGVPVTVDFDSVLRRTDVDIILHAGLGTPQEVANFVGRCADAGKDAITVSGLVHPPTALGQRGAQDLDDRARRGGARVVGTGVNPGFVLDALPALWGSMVTRVDRIYARRVSEIRNWGEGVLDTEVRLGWPPDEVRGNRALSLDESLAVIIDALGLAVDRTEDIHEALPAPTPRSHGGRSVDVGRTMGFRRRSLAYRDGAAAVEVEWIAIFCIDSVADGVKEEATLRIEGDTDVEASANGTFCGDPYPSTAARAINAIAPLRTLAPGLYRPDQLPAFSVGTKA